METLTNLHNELVLMYGRIYGAKNSKKTNIVNGYKEIESCGES